MHTALIGSSIELLLLLIIQGKVELHVYFIFWTFSLNLNSNLPSSLSDPEEGGCLEDQFSGLNENA